MLADPELLRLFQTLIENLILPCNLFALRNCRAKFLLHPVDGTVVILGIRVEFSDAGCVLSQSPGGILKPFNAQIVEILLHLKSRPGNVDFTPGIPRLPQISDHVPSDIKSCY